MPGNSYSAPSHSSYRIPQDLVQFPMIQATIEREHQKSDFEIINMQFCVSFNNRGELMGILNECLKMVTGWMRTTKLQFNPDKTEVLLVNEDGDLG